jgi:hypothetical protein
MMTRMNYNDLAAHLKALNAKSAAWVAEDPKNRFASGLTEDLAHWHEYGVKTADDLDHYLLVVDVFEMTRSLYGYKPSWADLMAQSNTQLLDQIQSLKRESEEQAEAESAEREKEASYIRTQSPGFTIGDLITTL